MSKRQQLHKNIQQSKDVERKIVRVYGNPEVVVVSDSECSSQSDIFASPYERSISLEDESPRQSHSESHSNDLQMKQIGKDSESRRRIKLLMTPFAQLNQCSQEDCKQQMQPSLERCQKEILEDDTGLVTWTLQQQQIRQQSFDKAREANVIQR